MKLFGPKLPEEVAKRVPPGQRLVKTWPVLHYGPIPSFDPATWDLEVSGLVDNPFRLSYDELKALGPKDVGADMHCVTGWSTLDNTWTGVPFRVLAEKAGVQPEAKWVIAQCDYSYTSDLSLEAMMGDDVLVAWAHDGQDLTPEHGFPLRLVVPQRYAWKSAKWLRGIEFSATDKPGFWERNGYHNTGDPWKEERYWGDGE